MKIKTKKQLNLPQLIEWAWENDVRGKRFETITQEGVPGIVHVTDGRGISIDRPVFEGEMFTVEVEEEIKEDTVLSTIIECDEDDTFWVFKEITLKEMHESKCLKETTKYYKDEDEKMTLIWRDGKLVE